MHYSQRTMKKAAGIKTTAIDMHKKREQKFPAIGDTVIGLFATSVDDKGYIHKHRSGKPTCKVTMVYSATKIGVASGDIFIVEHKGNNIYQALN